MAQSACTSQQVALPPCWTRTQTMSIMMSYDHRAYIFVNKIMYAIPAWYGFLDRSHILQINGLFKSAFKYVYVKSVISLEQLLQDYDDELFHKATYGNHVTHHLLPSLKSSGYNLRTLDHGLCVNFIKFQLHSKNSLTEQYSIPYVLFLLCCVFSLPVLS